MFLIIHYFNIDVYKQHRPCLQSRLESVATVTLHERKRFSGKSRGSFERKVQFAQLPPGGAAGATASSTWPRSCFPRESEAIDPRSLSDEHVMSVISTVS